VERVWLDGPAPPRPPYGTGDDVLFVAYYASAELCCHLALGWPTPLRVLDLFAEFRCMTAGLPVPSGNSLLGALAYFGLPAIDAAEKESMRALALRGGPYNADEKRALLDYCQSDVDALARLLHSMLPQIDLPRALLRGRYMAAAARMEWNGVPIDVETLGVLRDRWGEVKGRLIRAVNEDYCIWVPTNPKHPDGPLSFSSARFEDYLARAGIAWPRLDTGPLALDDDTFRDMAKMHPTQIGPIRELLHTLDQMRLNDLAVGPDGRNRVLLSAFASKTGRNQPSNSGFIFGPSCWLRSLIKPPPGRAVAYVDWSQQELAIAAALSGDPKMMAAYVSGDFYLTFAKMAGAVPADATKKSHARERDQFKVVSLGVLYGLSAEGLARKLGVSPAHGRWLLQMHRETFPVFWAWSQRIQDAAMLTGESRTVFGWTVHVGPDARPNSLRNFPMQANGAEMMRLAACLATERGIGVCCPIHDAFLIEADAGALDDEAGRMQAAMREASELVLPGFPLRTDVKCVRHPERYADDRGREMWATVTELLNGPAGCPAGETAAAAGVAAPPQGGVAGVPQDLPRP
jgi:hypothetical protein